MTDTLTIDLTDEVAGEIRRAAQAAGLTLEQFVTDSAARRAKTLILAEAFFAERAKGADPERLRRFLTREGGEPPQAGDEAD